MDNRRWNGIGNVGGDGINARGAHDEVGLFLGRGEGGEGGDTTPQYL